MIIITHSVSSIAADNFVPCALWILFTKLIGYCCYFVRKSVKSVLCKVHVHNVANINSKQSF